LIVATKKILIMGLGADASEAAVRSRLDRFGRVVRVDIVREGSAANPSALVEMDISDKAAEYLVFRLNRFRHEDALVRARLLNH
jgi:hypothetical protein